MKINKWTPIFMAGLIVFSTFFGMSLKVNEPAAEASVDFSGATDDETENPNGAHGTISITGSAFRECAPDRLIILLKIIGDDPQSAIKARDEASTIIDQVLKALKNIGIAEDSIGTNSFNIQPVYEWENRENIFKGYKATVTMKVTLKENEFDKAGNVIDVSVNAGALVDSISFELSRAKRDEIKLELLAEAAKDAKLRASTIVTALDDTLGNVKSVTVDNYGYQPQVYWRSTTFGMDNGAASSAPPTTIMPSDLTVSANVNVVFEIL